jgi:hypothetical protein
MSTTTGSSSHSASISATASSACERDSATTAAQASPCEHARSIAIACCGGDLMPFRCASTATHGVQYSATALPSKHADDSRLLQGFREIQALDPRVRVGTPEKRDVRKAREAQVVDERAASLQQALRVRPRHALADVAPVELRARARAAAAQPFP